MGVRVPKKVFSGATLDLLFTGEIEKIDQAFRPYIYAFAKDFLDCDCESNPYCEHPERKFMKYILRLRGEKRSPKEIVKKMEEDYMIYAYPSDLVTFLDDSIRTLEVLEAMADTMGDIEKKDQIRKEKELLI